MTDKKRPLPHEKAFFPITGGGAIQDEDAFTRIANAIMRMRSEFIKAGFVPPVAIELASHKDGDRMRHILPTSMVTAYPAVGRDENETDILFNICGVEFRYPAHYRRNPKGGTDIV